LWSTATNWIGGSVPGTSDTAVFNSSATTNSSINTTASVAGLDIQSGYTGTVTQSASLLISGNLTVSAGTLAVGTQTLAVSGNSTVTGGTVTIGAGAIGWSTAGMTIGTGGVVTVTGAAKITVSGNWNSSAGTFTYGQSTVTMTAAAGNVTMATSVAGSWYSTRFYILNINTVNKVSWISGASIYAPTMNITGTFEINSALTAASQKLTINDNSTLSGAGVIILTSAANGATPLVLGTNTTISISRFTYAISQGHTTVIVTATTYGGSLSVYNNNAGSAAAILGPGILTVLGNFNIYHLTSGSAITLNNSVNNTPIYVGGSVDFKTGGAGNGIFTSGTSTFTLTGTGANGKILSNGSAFYNLTQNGTGGTYTLQDPLVVSGNLSVASGTLAIGTNDLTVTGSSNVTGGTVTIGVSAGAGWSTAGMTIGTGGVVTVTGAAKITVSGNWDSAAGVFTCGQSEVWLTGSGNVRTDANYAYPFYKIHMAAPGMTTTLTGLVYVSNTTSSSTGLYWGGGTVNFNGKTLNYRTGAANSLDATGTTVSGTGTLYLQGYYNTTSVLNNLNLGSVGIRLGTTDSAFAISTFSLTGTINTASLNVQGGSVSGKGAILKTNAGLSLTVGTLNFANASWTNKYSSFDGTSGGTINAGTVSIGYTAGDSRINSFTMGSTIWNVSGNWINYYPSLDKGTSVVNFIGTGGSNTITSSGASFYNLTQNGTGGTYTLQDPLVVSGDFTLTAGTFNAGSVTIMVGGNWDSALGTFIRGASTIILTGTGTLKSGGANYLGKLQMAASGQTTTLLSHIYAIPPGGVTGSLIWGGGAINFNGYNLNMYPAAETFNGNGTTVFGGGSFNVLAYYGNIVTLTNLNLGTTTLRLTNSSSLSSSVVILSGSIACGTLMVSGGSNPVSQYNVTLRTAADASITCSALSIGPTSYTGQGSFDGTAGGTINVNGNVSLGTKTYAVNLGSSTFNVTGNWMNTSGIVVAPGSSVVNLKSTSSAAQILSGTGSSFYNLILNGTGGTYTLQDPLVVSGNLTLTAGTLNTKSGSNYGITVGGNWANTGTFTPQWGTVTLNGTNQTISGNTTFYNLTKSVTSADTLTFTAGTTQVISNILQLNGTSGQLLSLRSSVPGTQWSINPQGTRTLSYLDVADSNNINITPISMTGNYIILTDGNNVGWGILPGVPTGLVGDYGDGQIVLTWLAPGFLGDPSLTDYAIDYKPTSTSTWSIYADSVSVSTTFTVIGLINGSAYNFRVSAINATGQGDASNIATATPATIPGAPTISTTTPGNTSVSVSFILTNDGGSAITAYTVTSIPGGIQSIDVASPILVSGLTNGTPYTFTMTATNAVGTGPISATSSPAVTPATVPGEPTAVTPTAGDRQVSLSWSAPASNGGSEITDYVIDYKINSDSVWSQVGHTESTSTAIIATGLTNGSLYDFRISARNDMGVGNPSTPLVNSTPRTVPGQPTITSAVSGDRQVTVNFTAPNNGGAEITSYTVSSDDGGTDSNSGSTSLSHIVTGLTNGQTYTFTVVATNVAGPGLASDPSGDVIPAGIPGIPDGLAATPGNALVNLSWAEPANNGAEITNYVIEYKLHTDESWTQVGHAVSPLTTITVTDLINGSLYDFQVSAINIAGTSEVSTPPVSSTPRTVPGQPAITSVERGNGQVTVNFTSPVSDGGSIITGYTVTSDPQGIIQSGTTSSIIIGGLTNGTEYTFTVKATNVAGDGPASTSSSPITPATVPGKAIDVVAVAGNTQAIVTFVAPLATGGSNITGYVVTSSGGGTDSNSGSTNLSHIVTGLTNGAAYTFTVVATNDVGSGLASDASVVITLPTIPTAPLNLAAVVKSSSIDLIWSDSASTGGSAITDYVIEYQLTTGGSWVLFNDGVSVDKFTTVTGLANNTSYDFRVSAKNIIGQSIQSNIVTATPGEPAQVFIQGFPDLTNTSIGTNVRITNEGLIEYEYQYTWCVTDAVDNLCGDGDDVFSASNAKLIGSHENYDFAAISTVPNPDNYFFHIKVLYGSQSSSAFQSFTAVATFPDPPTSVSAVAGNAQATVSFTIPASNGGSSITNYTVTSNPGGLTGTGFTTPIIVTGLTNGTAYTFTMTATNIIGTGLSSSPPSNSVTPVTVPGSITSFSASAGNKQVGLFWSAPASNGGSVITDYVIEYKLSSDSVWTIFAEAISTATTVVVTGLANNLSYDFRVSAVNAVGQGPVNSTSATSANPPSENTSRGGGSSGGYYIYPPMTIPPNAATTTPTTPNIVPAAKVPKTISPTTSNTKPIKNEVSITPTETSHITPPVKQKQTPVDNSGENKTSGVPWVWIIVPSALVFFTGFIIFILRRRRMDDQEN
jgi:hypothetical protein